MTKLIILLIATSALTSGCASYVSLSNSKASNQYNQLLDDFESICLRGEPSINDSKYKDTWKEDINFESKVRSTGYSPSILTPKIAQLAKSKTTLLKG